MNERDLRSKKQSVTSIKNFNDKTMNNSHIKLGPVCQPKQPPNISRHFLQAKNRQGYSKQFRPEPSKQCYQTQKARSKILIQNRPSRPSNTKKQQQHQIKKTKRQPHYISKPHKAKTTKMNSKQNKESRSNFDFEQNRRQKQKMMKTQVFQGKLAINSVHQLTCKQKLIKIPKSFKPKSMDLNFNFQVQTRTTSQHHTVKKTFAQQMSQFEALNPKIQISFQSETLSQLFCKQQTYSRIQNYNCYLNKKQPFITWATRAKVVNWMIQFLSQLGARRQIFGLAVNYFDRYLALTCNIPQQKLQTLACSTMSIANKIDGTIFNTKSLAMPTISLCQILQLQQQIYKILKWKLNPPTLNMWSNRIIQHWDIYLEHNIQKLPRIIQQNIGQIKFKDINYQASYMNFRTLMQFIDLVILDVQTLQYHNREIAASFIYILLNNNLNIYNYEIICMKFPNSSKYLFEQNQLNDFYSQFLQHSFGFCLQDLLPTIQYCSTFVNLELNYGLPIGTGESEDKQLPFSQFCALMTFNPNNMKCLINRNRQFN